ncbi:hypothetical protein [Nocardia vaccinii]|uniref:hypothetical protein n=1 Tax=Nocardia vaccinii TaxID=1822 RepID=UPI000831823A|nr:hypothetical protein [Nocardia vaccinii]
MSENTPDQSSHFPDHTTAGEYRPRQSDPDAGGPAPGSSGAQFPPLSDPVLAQLRDGPIAHRFGADDSDAVHAKLLRTVQDASAARSEWMTEAVDHDLATSDPAWRWALYSNGIDADVRDARANAEQAGVPATDIIDAEALGSARVSWAEQPAHRHLGRIELLSREVFDANNRAETARGLVGDIAERFDRLYGVIDTLSEGLNRARSMVSDLAMDLAANGLPLTTTGASPDPPGTEHDASVLATGAETQPDTGVGRAEGGSGIGDAVGAALPDTGQTRWATAEPPPAAANQQPPVQPEVGR